jgi:LacI family transcriptional regulator
MTPRPLARLPSPRTATLQSVAEAAGVHRSTAARALDPAQSHRISREVVQRVQEEARRQGYRRDAIAASLRTGRSRLVGVLLPDLANPVFAPILAGITAELEEAGYLVLVAASGGPTDDQLRIVEELIARRIDGLVLATARRQEPVVDACLAAGIPVVLVNRGEDEARVSAVITDDISGMQLAVEHLVGLGHVRIGHLAGPEELSTGILRRKGFEAAIQAAGLNPGAVVTASAYSREQGEAATAELLDRNPNLTAIAASNDLLALGAYRELQARGLACPGDVSVVGHNDMPLVDMVEPSLTTVRIGLTAMGKAAAQLLLAEVAEQRSLPVTQLTSAELIIRASTAAPRRKR